MNPKNAAKGFGVKSCVGFFYVHLVNTNKAAQGFGVKSCAGF